MSKTQSIPTQAVNAGSQASELASQTRRGSSNKDSSLKRVTSLNSCETSSEHSSDDARPTINFGSLDNFDEVLQQQEEGKKGLSGMDFSFCGEGAAAPVVQQRNFYSKKYESASVDKVILYSCLYAHSFIQQRKSGDQGQMRLLRKATDRIVEALTMGIEVIEWRKTSKKDKKGLKDLKVLEHFIKEFGTLAQSEARLVLDYIEEDVTKQLMEAVTSLQEAASQGEGSHGRLIKITEALNISIQLVEGWEKINMGPSGSLVRLSLKRSAKNGHYRLSKIKIGEQKPRERSTEGLSDISFGQD